MSGTALNHARAIRVYADGKPLKPSEKQILMLLADSHNGKNSQCNPAIKDLVFDSGLSRRSVIYALGKLEEAGFIAVQHGTQGKTQRQGVNAYTFPGMASGVQWLHPLDNEAVQSLHSSGATIAPHLVQPLHPTGAVIAPPTTLEPEENRNLEPEEDEDEDEDADAIAPPAVAFEPVRLNAEQKRDLATHDVVARYFELFACPTFLNAKGRIAGDIGKVAGKYKPEQLLRYLEAVGRQHPNAKARKEFLTSRPETLSPAVAAYMAAGCPDELPARIELSSTGASNAGRTNGTYANSGNTDRGNRYREDEEVEAAITERSRRQLRQVPA